MAVSLSLRTKLTRARAVLSISAISIFLTWLGIASFLAVMFGGSPFDNNPFDNANFNRSQWVADESVSDGSNRRGSMAQSIVRHHLTQGMSPQQVMALLGPQGGVAYLEKYFRHGRQYYSDLSASEYEKTDQVLCYLLGEELDMAWGIDHAELYVFFQNGRYVGSRIGWPG